jgi:hypothetical protein
VQNKSQDDHCYRGFRHRQLITAILFLLTIFLGLLSRSCFNPFPMSFGKYPGDALWAVMLYWIATFIAPARSPGFRSAMALGISILDEISQCFHPAWLDGVRSTTIGHLVLGTDFSVKDIVAYAVGIGLVAVIDMIVIVGFTLTSRAGKNQS